MSTPSWRWRWRSAGWSCASECARRAAAPAPGPPLWLLLELTYRCPLHCVFCYNPTDFASTGPELATEEWLRVLREARALGAVQLGLSGGEPLARDDLEVLVAEAHALGFYINLITSGIGLTEARIAALKQAGLDHIQLSFQDSTRADERLPLQHPHLRLQGEGGGADPQVRLPHGAQRRAAPAQHRPRRGDPRRWPSAWARSTWSWPTRSTTAGPG